MSDPTPEPAPPHPFSSLGLTSGTETAADAYARILILAPPKCGKTVAIATTAPAPVLILNCDGVGATTGANRINESYTAEDRRPFYVLDGIQSLKSLDAAVTKAEKAVALGCKSVALDTANILVDYLTAELTEQFKDDGFSVYRELEFAISKAVRRLKKLNAHLFVTGHMTPGYEGEAGVLPSVGGKLKTKIPGMLHDMILMDCVASRKPNERSFIVGPQDKWNSSGRNIKKSCVIEADVTLLLETLGIEP